MLINSTWTLSISTPTILVRCYHLELVKNLHHRINIEIGSEQIPSTSFSGICGKCSYNQDFIVFEPEHFYQLSLCGLNEPASKAIMELNLHESLEFLGAKFNIINRENRITSYEELYTQLVANEPEPTHKFNLQFSTPTAFAQYGGTLPLPLPSSMVRNWLERWNNFAPIYLGGEELIAYLSHSLFIKYHRTQTRNLQLQKGYISGFIGDVVLQMPHRADPLLAHVTNLLIQYSEFAGTGMKTRLGMGKTIFLNQDI